MLAAEVFGVPVQHVAEQHRGFVVEVVPRGDGVVVAVDRGLVEEMAFGESRTRCTAPRRAALAPLGMSKP